MRVRDWDDVLADIAERPATTDDWRAVVGTRRRGLGEDVYLAHPRLGVYALKTFAKNPFEVRGVGTRVARSVDEELAEHFPDRDHPARFAINRAPSTPAEATDRARSVEAVIEAHHSAPTDPTDLFVDLMEAIESPAHGPLALGPNRRSTALDGLSGTFEEADAVLDEELDRRIDRSGVGRGVY
ncbi:MAG: hypothetical protein ACLFMX_01845 [Halobacteriales archaeon]